VQEATSCVTLQSSHGQARDQGLQRTGRGTHAKASFLACNSNFPLTLIIHFMNRLAIKQTRAISETVRPKWYLTVRTRLLRIASCAGEQLSFHFQEALAVFLITVGLFAVRPKRIIPSTVLDTVSCRRSFCRMSPDGDCILADAVR